MGKADTCTKDYMGRSVIFADMFNFFLYDGEQVIKPSDLTPVDSAELSLPYGDSGSDKPLQKQRDILKEANIMRDGRATYLLLGVENQTAVHYAMAVRNMLYDAIRYSKQVRTLAAQHKKEKIGSGSEYLSGFRKEDKLTPVITLVVLFSPKPWDGAMSLRDMMSVQDPKLLEFIPDYKLNLVQPAALDDAALMKFQTSLREVLGYIRCSEDKDQLVALVNHNPRFEAIEPAAAMVINSCTKTNIKWKPEDEVIDVCKAIRDLINDSKSEGRLEGKQEGRLEGRLEGKQEGKQEGKLEGKRSQARETAVKLMRLNMPLTQIADLVGFDTETVSAWLSEGAAAQV